MISLAADLAFESRKPVAYMDKTLEYWEKQGIRTAEAVREDRKAHSEQYAQGGKQPAAKTVTAQQYTQRDYTGEQEAAMAEIIASIKKEKAKEEQTDGDESHA